MARRTSSSDIDAVGRARAGDELRPLSSNTLQPIADTSFNEQLEALVRLLARQAAQEHFRFERDDSPLPNYLTGAPPSC